MKRTHRLLNIADEEKKLARAEIVRQLKKLASTAKIKFLANRGDNPDIAHADTEAMIGGVILLADYYAEWDETATGGHDGVLFTARVRYNESDEWALSRSSSHDPEELARVIVDGWGAGVPADA